MSAARRLAFVVVSTEAGERVDRVCAERYAAEGISRSTISRLCDSGDVVLAGRAAKASARVKEGDEIAITLTPPEALSAGPEDIPLVIVHEDDALLVIDKPAGLVVHPARGHASGTLVNAVLFHADVAAGEDDAELRPGIVHRLDKDTSGVLVVAKTAAAREALKAQFQAHSIERSYTAITVGIPPAEVQFDTLHGRHPTDRLRFSSKVREGRRAVTSVRVEESFPRGPAALVRCHLQTGRTHQIRMHLSEGGYPLLGDTLYGKRPRSEALRAIGDALGRQALHAEVLGFVHPTTGLQVRFTAPPPRDFAMALDAIRAL